MDISILFRNNWANIDSWHWSSKIGEFWYLHYWILRRHPMAQFVVIWRKKWLIWDYYFIPIFVVGFHLFSQTFNLWHLRAIVQHFWSSNSLIYLSSSNFIFFIDSSESFQRNILTKFEVELKPSVCKVESYLLSKGILRSCPLDLFFGNWLIKASISSTTPFSFFYCFFTTFFEKFNHSLQYRDSSIKTNGRFF